MIAREERGNVHVVIADQSAEERPDLDRDETYFGDFPIGSLARDRTASLAVVVHFYYIDGWEHVVDSLRRLSGVRYDLFVTVPENRIPQSAVVREQIPEARVVVVPNHGKDCYPFIRLAVRLSEAGYTKALKLHTKRLMHAIDAQWQVSALEQLIPSDPQIVNATIAELDVRDVAMIGPERYYLPLYAAIAAVGDVIRDALTEMYDAETAEYVLRNQPSFGFFAGTMFWMRLDALHGNASYRYGDFPEETGQKDGTLAHAVERLFCVVPQLEHRRMLQLTATALQPRPHAFEGDVIPWDGT